MELLFRSPLLQFDINDPSEVKKHWPKILESIRLSSMDLFLKIQLKQPDDLTEKEKHAVYKYLLRGKYRPTPFGNWAGVGVASWSSTLQEKIESDSLSAIPIPILKLANPEESYWINPSMMPWGDGWKFWNFDKKTEKWRYSKAEDNLLMQRLRSLALAGKPITQEKLFAPFSELLQRDKQELWNQLLHNQLLVCSSRPSLTNVGTNVNMFIQEQPEVPISLKHKLENFFSDIDHLATPTASSYLKSFKDIFITEFDDRFVPIKMLWKLVSRLKPTDTEQEERNVHHKIYHPSETGKQSILDLQNPIYQSNKSHSIKHAQCLFRILDNGQLLLDNLVLNRPFVYGGRFTYQTEIFNFYAKRTLEEDTLLADVLLMEGVKANLISAHKNVAKFRINCFSGSTDRDELDSSDVYIGIFNGKFHLSAPKFGKFIIPVFQHPLNPQFITHPLCRILWEVAHQDFLRPAYYSPGYFQNQDYTPQLNYGDIILQPRQWKIKWEERFLQGSNLLEELLKKGVPKRILAGNQDQELGLNLESNKDVDILCEELRKNKSIRIQEWLWENNKATGEGKKFNLQYLWGMHLPYVKDALPEVPSLNYLSGEESKNWLSIRIILIPDYQQTVVMQQIRLLVDSLAWSQKPLFYFLYYGIRSPEIRLRIKLYQPEDKNKLLSAICSTFRKVPEVDYIKLHPYYPEKSKYSEEGMYLSEQLFNCESQLLLNLNPRSDEDKLSLAMGVGSLFLEKADQLEYWIDHFRKLSGQKAAHVSAKSYLHKFHELADLEWRNYYCSVIERHPWYRDVDKRPRWIGNHIHMLVNRIYWDAGLEMEAEVNALLWSFLRDKKYAR